MENQKTINQKTINRKTILGLCIGISFIILLCIAAGIVMWYQRGYMMDSYVYFGIFSLIEIILVCCISYNIYKMRQENINYAPLATGSNIIQDPYNSN